MPVSPKVSPVVVVALVLLFVSSALNIIGIVLNERVLSWFAVACAPIAIIALLIVRAGRARHAKDSDNAIQDR